MNMQNSGNTTYSVQPGVYDIVNNGLFLSGSGRTGTSMMASLLHSTAEVELIFEPPLLRCLLATEGEIADHLWKFLFEAYLFEDHMIDAMAGRRINLNRLDQSSIYNAKSTQEIEARLLSSKRRTTLFHEAQTRRTAFKIPDMLPAWPRISKLYPGFKCIAMVRRAEPVIFSTVAKGWLSDQSLRTEFAYWPLKTVGSDLVPYIVLNEDVEWWNSMNEVERCCYVYVKNYGSITAGENLIAWDYDQFVENPKKYMNGLMAHLGLSSGPLTDGLISNVEEPEKDRSIDLSDVDLELLSSVRKVEEAAKIRASTFMDSL